MLSGVKHLGLANETLRCAPGDTSISLAAFPSLKTGKYWSPELVRAGRDLPQQVGESDERILANCTSSWEIK